MMLSPRRFVVLFCLLGLSVDQPSSAFTAVFRTSRPSFIRLRESPKETQLVELVEPVDYPVEEIQDSVEQLELITDKPERPLDLIDNNARTETLEIEMVENKLADVKVTKEDLIEAIEQELPPEKRDLVSDLLGKLSFVTGDHSAKEAAVSASLYMNPATEKIAPYVKITWEPQVAEILLALEKISNPARPFMVGLVGIPGSGKSTSADILAQLLGEDRCVVCPMDGYHLELAELSEQENASDMIWRRGAPDTFDPSTLFRDLDRIAYGVEEAVSIPGFDHAAGDPQPDRHTFERSNHRICIFEGLYLLHDADGWENIRSFFDWTIYIDADVDVCIERLKERNKCIPGYTAEEIAVRCDEVDRRNAETARDAAYKFASQIVKSGAEFEQNSSP